MTRYIKSDELYHFGRSKKNVRYIMHSDEESKSKYKGGFINGKNTSEYNHNYYLANKEKWKKNIKNVTTTLSTRFSRKAKAAKAGVERFESSLYKFLSGNPDAKKKVELVEGSGSGMKVKTGDGKYKYKYRVDYKGKRSYFYSDAEYYEFLENVKKKNGQSTIQEDCASINEDYPDDDYTRNCWSCTLAYEMRRRGYDVKSVPAQAGMYSDEILSMYKGAKFQHVKSSDDMFSKMDSYANGARGIVRVTWKTGGGHVMNWEKRKGQVYIIDCQTNTVMNKGKFNSSNNAFIDWDSAEYFRADDLQLTRYISDAELFRER